MGKVLDFPPACGCIACKFYPALRDHDAAMAAATKAFDEFNRATRKALDAMSEQDRDRLRFPDPAAAE